MKFEHTIADRQADIHADQAAVRGGWAEFVGVTAESTLGGLDAIATDAQSSIEARKEANKEIFIQRLRDGGWPYALIDEMVEGGILEDEQRMEAYYHPKYDK